MVKLQAICVRVRHNHTLDPSRHCYKEILGQLMLHWAKMPPQQHCRPAYAQTIPSDFWFLKQKIQQTVSCLKTNYMNINNVHLDAKQGIWCSDTPIILLYPSLTWHLTPQTHMHEPLKYNRRTYKSLPNVSDTAYKSELLFFYRPCTIRSGHWLEEFKLYA